MTFQSDLQTFQFLDKYSRFDYAKGRRETWSETVDRVILFLRDLVDDNAQNDLPNSLWLELHTAIKNLEIMPSMRNLAMAGKATKRSNVCCYNCAYMPISDFQAFYEAVIILMSGVGLGYSVESKYVDLFPVVEPQCGIVNHHTIKDTTEGWAEAILYGITMWFDGEDVNFDYTLIRPEGTPLKTKGGRASGAASLKVALTNIKKVILSKQGERLRPLDVHDIMCFLARAIVSGGVRRSAMIALFDFEDQEMRTCKDSGQIEHNTQRWVANNSAVFTKHEPKEVIETFMRGVFDSQRGEPGIFSRYSANLTIPYRREKRTDWGLNPCAEIILRPYQFCNLTSVVCRPHDTVETLLRKVRLATILGTIQSLAIYFPNLRPEWAENCRDERLLGVDLNGIMDCEQVRDIGVLSDLRFTAVETNKEFADLFGINQSAAITTVKPSGNSSTLLDVSPGIHARHSSYYIRRAQVQNANPIAELFRKQAPDYIEPMVGSEETTSVLKFPVKAPDKAIIKDNLTAAIQCDLWRVVKLFYTEHNPSVTVTYKEDERQDITDWVFENQEIIGGMSFLPHFDAQYAQMPYEAINGGEYYQLVENYPGIDWQALHDEVDNMTPEYACTSEKCEIVF